MSTATVAITGGTRGIGFGMAQALLARGHRVAVCGTDPERTDRVRAELPDSALVHAADVTDRDQVQGFWNAAVERFGVWISGSTTRASPTRAHLCGNWRPTMREKW